MAASKEQHQSLEETTSDNLPLVLIHRLPQFDLSFKSWLPTRFRIFDPLHPAFSSPQAQALAQSVRVLLCLGPSPVTSETFDRYPSVECVVGSSAGLDHVDLAECHRRGVRVTNAGDAFSEDVADYAVALLIDVLRRVSAGNRYIRDGLWPVNGQYPLGFKAQALTQSVRVLLCLGPCQLTSETLDRFPSVECVVCSSTGLDRVNLPECSRRGIRVTNAGDAFSEDVADYAVALLIDVLRGVSAGNRYIRAGLWPVKGQYPLGFKLGGKRVGIVGLGSIGSMIAKRLEAFGCSIAYNSRRKKPYVSFPYYENVKELATNSDALIICCALTDETYHMINKDVMTALGKEGVIVNVGRGALIDEKELVQFLVQGNIGGAGLDVYEHEPKVPRELFELDNVVLSPHTAVSTPEAITAVQEVVIANLDAFFANKPLRSQVEIERRDCSILS